MTLRDIVDFLDRRHDSTTRRTTVIVFEFTPGSATKIMEDT